MTKARVEWPRFDGPEYTPSPDEISAFTGDEMDACQAVARFLGADAADMLAMWIIGRRKHHDEPA